MREVMDMDSIVTVLQAVLAVLVVSSILIGLVSLRNELRRSRRRRLAFLNGDVVRPVAAGPLAAGDLEH
jgi:hypothetical protein